MTMLHTGWTKKFGAAWDSIFSGKKAAASKPKAAKASAAGKKKMAKKKANTKKASKGKR